MPPKGKAPKLHVLAAEIPAGFKFIDTNKKEFVLGKQFATGGFGRIYTCTEAGKKEQLCVKVEPSGNGPLFVEIAVFQRALKLDMMQAYCKEKKLKSVGLPHMISGGIFDYKDDKMRFLVMPKYAGSLEAVREKTGRLDASAAIAVAKANVRSLDYLASKNYTHGDIKSINILLPSPTDFDGAVLVDFGLARMASSNVEKADKKRDDSSSSSVTAPVPLPSAAMSSRRAAIYGNLQSTPAVIPPISTSTNKSNGGISASSLSTECALYIDQCFNSIDVHHEALDFWRINHAKFPRLAVLARQYLSTPPTSVSAERVFSAAAHNGTAIFTSLDAHRGFQPSYRGDVEILVYNIVYWISGNLPWQPKESNPAAVQTEKEVWEKNAEKEIERLIGAAIGGPVAKIYRLAQKTPYTDFVDTVAVLKLLDQALAACKKPSTSKKAESTPKVERKSSTSKRVATKRVVKEESEEEEEEEEVIPKSTSRRVRKPVIDSEESADEPTPVKPTKRTTVPKRAGSELVDASTPSSREDRMRKRTASVEPSALSSPTRKPSDPKQRRPIPGLANRAVKKEEEEDEEMKEEKSTSKARRPIPGLANRAVKKEEEDSDEEEEKPIVAKARRPIPGLSNRVVKKIVEEDEEGEGEAMNASESDEEEEKPKGVGSAVKANKEDLRRMVPGMRNLEKGRRSEIISQIARKHKK